MPDRAPVTFHTHSESKAGVDERPLSKDALAQCRAEEEAFIASVERGQADARAGRVHTTDAARRRLTRSIA
jgi:predicted transcriptional regulator